MRPRQASVLACVVLAGTSEGLAGPRVLEEARLGVAAPSDLTGSLQWKFFIVLKVGT